VRVRRNLTPPQKDKKGCIKTWVRPGGKETFKGAASGQTDIQRMLQQQSLLKKPHAVKNDLPLHSIIRTWEGNSTFFCESKEEKKKGEDRVNADLPVKTVMLISGSGPIRKKKKWHCSTRYGWSGSSRAVTRRGPGKKSQSSLSGNPSCGRQIHEEVHC